jgi:hypothetical protein
MRKVLATFVTREWLHNQGCAASEQSPTNTGCQRILVGLGLMASYPEVIMLEGLVAKSGIKRNA